MIRTTEVSRGGQPRVLGAGGGELSTLIKVSVSAPPALAPVRVLLDSQVPDNPGVSTMTRQHPLGLAGT
jgi:hypothetical protein